MRYILLCEDSLEGIFSAVYAAWEQKYIKYETAIYATNHNDTPNMELFTEYITIPTDVNKANKVIQTIQRNYKSQNWENLYYAACSNQEDKADVVFNYIKLLLQKGNQVINCLTNPYIIRSMELNRAVENERHHYLGFLRFIETPDNILLAKYHPKNNLTGSIMPHFSDRLSMERFIIWDTGRNIAGIYVPQKGYFLIYLTKEQTDNLSQYDEDKLQMEDLWNIFVKNISIEERENKELQRNNIPLRFRDYMPEFQERVKTKMEEYLN